MVNIVTVALNLLSVKAKIFTEATKNPIKEQERVLFKYLARNRNTEYGKKYDFSSIRSISEFMERLPLVDYSVILPYVERMEQGENNILTKDKVIFFGVTSGSTGKQKLIPVTQYSRDKKAEAMSLWAYYVCKDHPSVFTGKILGIISPEIKSHTAAGIPYGPEDGHAYNNLPEMVKQLYVIPYEVFYISDYDARYYCMLRIAMEHNITTIATLNPSTIVLLCQRIDKLKEKVIDDIERGTLNKDFDIPANAREAIEKTLRPNPKRAEALRTIIKEKRALLPKDFWPDMDLIECWKGGTVKLYLDQLPQYFGSVAIRDFGCLSTEARNSIPIDDKGATGVLAIHTNFYEFIPQEDMEKGSMRSLLCTELEVGKNYCLVVTTPGGLYRYNIDDIITVKGFYNKTPIIEFVQKGHNVISLTGEKVYEHHVSEAVRLAANSHGILIDFFSATVQMTNPPRYVFFVEFTKNMPKEKKREFLVSAEKELFRQNSEYEDIRRQQLLAPIVLKVVQKGSFEKYRAKRVGQGAHDTQFKVMKLHRIPDFEKNFVIEDEVFIKDSDVFSG